MASDVDVGRPVLLGTDLADVADGVSDDVVEHQGVETDYNHPRDNGYSE